MVVTLSIWPFSLSEYVCISKQVKFVACIKHEKTIGDTQDKDN